MKKAIKYLSFICLYVFIYIGALVSVVFSGCTKMDEDAEQKPKKYKLIRGTVVYKDGRKSIIKTIRR